MLIVQEKYVVADDVVKEQFACNLGACKGACCWEGDMGAPLEPEEIPILEAIFPKVKGYLEEKGLRVLESEGLVAARMEENGKIGYETPLVNNGPCAYLVMRSGFAACGIELAWQDGLIDFQKPISCHLYPIRIQKYEATGMEALNYDRWDICSAACTKGKKEKIPVYRFVKDALVRRYGADFYEELDALAGFLDEDSNYRK